MALNKKIILSVYIGFLIIALFSIIAYITSAAASGNLIAKWTLLVIFGAIAVLLASYAIGYIILMVMNIETNSEIPKPSKKTISKKKSISKKKTTSKKRKKKKGR